MDVDIGSMCLQSFANNLLYYRRETCIVRVPERCMRNYILLLTLAEEGGSSYAFGPVNDLRWDNKIFWRNFLPKRTNGRKRQDCTHTQMLECSNVR